MQTTFKTLVTIGAALALAGAAGTAGAQQRAAGLEIRPFVGAFIPKDDNRDLFERAVLAGISAGYSVHRNVAVLATFGWAPTELKSGSGLIEENKLDLFQYDLGVQLHKSYALSGAWSITPLVGIGAGARTYDMREDGWETEHDFAAYTAIGAEVSRGRVGLHLTTREYVTAMEEYEAGRSGTMWRNDAVLAAGLTLRF